MKNNEMKENENENKNENLNIAALPHDVIVLILMRLPVRPLIRFKSVSKLWLSTISDPKFGKSHFDLAATAPTHRLLLKRVNFKFLPHSPPYSEIQSLDLQASLHDDSAVVNLKFPPYRAPYFMTLGSCRGLILLTKKKDPSIGDLIVWNPSTAAHKEIPVTYDDNWDSWYDPSTTVRKGIPRYIGSLLLGFLYGFGYDHARDDYFLVLIRTGGFEPEVVEDIGGRIFARMQFGGSEETTFVKPRIEVVSVKTNVPSFIYSEEVEYVVLGTESMSGLFLNQSLHWLAISRASRLHVVIAFDMVERSLSEIPLSPDLAEELSKDKKCCLRVLAGCLGLCYLSGGDGHKMTEIWVMEEYKVVSSWTKSFVLPDFLPICITEGGGLFGSDSNGRFKKFGNKGELLENHSYGQEDKCALKYFDMYRETLLTFPSELSTPGDSEADNVDA